MSWGAARRRSHVLGVIAAALLITVPATPAGAGPVAGVQATRSAKPSGVAEKAPSVARPSGARLLGGGGTITFTRDDNVYAIAPDGGQLRRLTSTGKPGASLSQASMDDRGSVVYAVTGKTILGFAADGTGKLVRPARLAPMDPGAAGAVGPLATSVNPQGTFLAYGYAALEGALGSYSQTWCSSVMAVDGLVHLRQWCGDWLNPTWYGAKLVASDGASLFLLDTESAREPTGLLPVAALNTIRWNGGMLARDGSGLVATGSVTNDSGQQVTVAAYLPVERVAGQLVPDVTKLCLLPPDVKVSAHRAVFSPDGTAVAWSDDDGIKVAGRPTGRDSNAVCTFPAAAPGQLLVPGGAWPSWSNAHPGAATVVVGVGTTPASLSAVVLARGLRLTVRCGAPCAVDARLVVPAALGKKLGLASGVAARGHTTVSRGGSGTVTLSLVPRARARLKALSGATATLTLRFTGGGAARTVTRTIRLT